MNKKFSKGFTLIELLVVISIISLLSSVILAAIKDAKDKAKVRAFRAEVMQFITASELYRNDNGMYPSYEGLAGSARIYYDNETGILSSEFEPGYFGDALKPYNIEKFPTPPFKNSDFFYLVNHSIYNKCWGDTVESPYIILVSSATKGFEDWPYWIFEGSMNTDSRCFSLK